MILSIRRLFISETLAESRLRAELSNGSARNLCHYRSGGCVGKTKSGVFCSTKGAFFRLDRSLSLLSPAKLLFFSELARSWIDGAIKMGLKVLLLSLLFEPGSGLGKLS